MPKILNINTVDTKTVSKAFKVEINGQYVPVKSYSGGDLTAEKAEASTGGAIHEQSTIGHNYISEITLTAYITPNQKVLSDVANMVANQGKNERFTITITELAKDKSPVKTFVYDDCMFTSLDFPNFDSDGGEILCQTATFKPQILSVK